MASNTPLHTSKAFTTAVAELTIDSVNEAILKPVGDDVYVRFDGQDPTGGNDDWFIPNGVPETFLLGHAVTAIKVKGSSGSGVLKVFGSRMSTDN